MSAQEPVTVTEGGFGSVRMRTINALMIVIASVISLVLLYTTQSATATYESMRTSTEDYFTCSQAATQLMDSSDYLTMQVRVYAYTHKVEHAENYFEELLAGHRREEAIQVLKDHVAGDLPLQYLETALDYSNTLAEREMYAIMLVMDVTGQEPRHSAEILGNRTLHEEDRALSDDEKLTMATDLLFDETYLQYKQLIEENVSLCSSELINETKGNQDRSTALLGQLLSRQQLLTVLFLLSSLGIIFLVVILILWPLAHYMVRTEAGQPLVPSGSSELRLFAHAYNRMYEENRRQSARLRHKAEHDPLTGLLNRGAYDEICNDLSGDCAMMLVDVDYFKGVNDTYGHEVGDEVLKKVARLLTHAFRATDYPCRIGGDEFAVIVTDITPDLKHVIVEKIHQVREGLRDTSDGLPVITLSVGVAFMSSLDDGESVFAAADRTLYVVKERGRNGFAFYDDLSAEERQ